MASGRIAGITIEIGGDTTKLVSALSKVDSAIKKTQTNLRDINKALKFDPGNTALLKDKQVELARAIEQTEQKLKQEKAALDQMRNTQGFDANSEAARNLKTQIDLDTAALKQLKAEAQSASSVLGTQMQLAGQKMQEVGQKIQSLGNNLAGIGRSMTTYVTTPIVGAFGASVKAAVDWETAFTGVTKTVDGTAKEYDQLAENIKKMATETASSKEEIAGVMEIAGQLGIKGVDNLTKFTKTMVELGDTTNLSAEDAATALARFMNITGESTANVDRIGSSIVDLGNNFATSESEIVEMATRLASAGTIAGMTSTDILALSAAMSSVGIQAEAGGTAMSQTLKAMASAVANFRDGEEEDLKVIADVSGMTAKEFADAWEDRPVEAMQAFIKGLANVKDEGENVFSVLGEMGMEGIRQTNMLQSLALASDMLSDAVHTSSEAYTENNALSAEASKRYETMAAKMSQFKERLKEVAIEVGETLMPYVEKLMDKIEELVDKWKSLDDSQKQMILKFAAIAAAIGPLLIVIGTLVSSLGSIISVSGQVVSGIGKLMSSMGGLSGVFTALTGPIGIAVAAIAAFAAGFAYLFATNDQFRSSVMQTINLIQNNFANALVSIQPQLQALGEAFNNLMQMLQPLFEYIFTGVMGVINGVISALGPLVEAITAVINIITACWTAFFALMTGDYQTFFQNALIALQNFWTMIVSLVQAYFAYINGYLQAFGTSILGVVQTIWTNIKNAVTTKLNEIKTTIQTVWNTIKTFISTILNTILTTFKTIFENIKSAVSQKIQEAKNAIIKGMEEAIAYLKSLPEQAIKWGADFIEGLIKGISSKLGALKSKIGEVAGAMASQIHFSLPDEGPLKDADTYMPDFMDLLVSGIDAGIPRIEQAMSGLASAMVPNLTTNGAQAMAGNNTVNITVYGAQGQDVGQLADIIEQKITDNVMRRGVAFA